MNMKQAITRIRKTLGKSAGIRDDGTPTSQEQRDADRVARVAASSTAKEAEAAMVARRTEILEADAEYQRLKQTYTDAHKAKDQTWGFPRWRYSAGTVAYGFYTAKAQADTLAELVEKIEAKQTTNPAGVPQ